jgi:hypothetical protein
VLAKVVKAVGEAGVIESLVPGPPE